MARKRVPGGFYLTLDGQDFTGKTTQLTLLKEKFSKEYDIFVGREPGSTVVAQEVRELLLDPGKRIDDRTEIFLYEAARASLFHDEILPALQKGKVVMMDRGYDSTTAYQGYGGQQDLDVIASMNKAATHGRSPDLTFILNLDSKTRLKRKGIELKDRLEQKDNSYQERVAQGFRAIAASEPGRCVLVDASKSIEDLHEEIYAITKQRIDEVMK